MNGALKNQLNGNDIRTTQMTEIGENGEQWSVAWIHVNSCSVLTSARASANDRRRSRLSSSSSVVCSATGAARRAANRWKRQIVCNAKAKPQTKKRKTIRTHLILRQNRKICVLHIRLVLFASSGNDCVRIPLRLCDKLVMWVTAFDSPLSLCDRNSTMGRDKAKHENRAREQRNVDDWNNKNGSEQRSKSAHYGNRYDFIVAHDHWWQFIFDWVSIWCEHNYFDSCSSIPFHSFVVAVDLETFCDWWIYTHLNETKEETNQM